MRRVKGDILPCVMFRLIFIAVSLGIVGSQVVVKAPGLWAGQPLGRNGKIVKGDIQFRPIATESHLEELRQLRGDRLAMVYQDPMTSTTRCCVLVSR
jgi:ABC-type dipeptide/oligopeptide/nickel transport system ATPase component